VVHESVEGTDNAMFDSMAANIADAVANPPRALLLRAQSKVTSTGVDVWNRLSTTIIHPLEALPCPVVYAAHGLTLTAAFEISLACDLILASPDAKFGLVESVVGLRPSMGGPQRLAERAGSARARERIKTGDLRCHHAQAVGCRQRDS
jgi:enoyl-CoA hydratase